MGRRREEDRKKREEEDSLPYHFRGILVYDLTSEKLGRKNGSLDKGSFFLRNQVHANLKQIREALFGSLDKYSSLQKKEEEEDLKREEEDRKKHLGKIREEEGEEEDLDEADEDIEPHVGRN